MADLSLHYHHTRAAAPPRRLPLGLGLSLGAAASCGLWTLVALAVRAVF